MNNLGFDSKVVIVTVQYISGGAMHFSMLNCDDNPLPQGSEFLVFRKLDTSLIFVRSSDIRDITFKPVKDSEEEK